MQGKLLGVPSTFGRHCTLPSKTPIHHITLKFARYDGDLSDLQLLKSKSKAFNNCIREAQYADDIAIFCRDAIGLQLLLTAYDMLHKQMALRVNIEKTKVMKQMCYFYHHVWQWLLDSVSS